MQRLIKDAHGAAVSEQAQGDLGGVLGQMNSSQTPSYAVGSSSQLDQWRSIPQCADDVGQTKSDEGNGNGKGHNRHGGFKGRPQFHLSFPPLDPLAARCAASKHSGHGLLLQRFASLCIHEGRYRRQGPSCMQQL